MNATEADLRRVNGALAELERRNREMREKSDLVKAAHMIELRAFSRRARRGQLLFLGMACCCLVTTLLVVFLTLHPAACDCRIETVHPREARP